MMILAKKPFIQKNAQRLASKFSTNFPLLSDRLRWILSGLPLRWSLRWVGWEVDTSQKVTFFTQKMTHFQRRPSEGSSSLRLHRPVERIDRQRWRAANPRSDQWSAARLCKKMLCCKQHQWRAEETSIRDLQPGRGVNSWFYGNIPSSLLKLLVFGGFWTRTCTPATRRHWSSTPAS